MTAATPVELATRAVRAVRRPTRIDQFEHLMSPGHIGSMALANRIVMPAMDMNLSHDGMIDDSEIAHLAARAQGGAALVTTGAAAVAYPEGATSRKQPGLSDDRFLPGLRALADGVHAAGGKVCVQLCHHGKVAAVDSADGRPLLVSTANTAGFSMRALIDTTVDEQLGLMTAREGKGDVYREATEQDLVRVITQFADAAGRVQAAGVDAVEVHAGHGYLLCAFLSSGYNRRTDRWGGSLENRARLTCEVLAAVRRRVGNGYPVLVRFDGQEFMLEGGISIDEAVEAARRFEAAGADALHVTGYSHDPFAGFTRGPLPSAVGAYRAAAKAVKQVVQIPVVAVGRILPEVGEEMVASGECDFVAMGRQLLADPDLPAKIRKGRRESVRPCINCYVCVERNFFDETPICAVNPSLGNQGPAEPSPAPNRRTVVVVGGGPAGMEAARLAAHRGHRVILLEREARLGGAAWFSALTDPANQPLLEWLIHELVEEGVEVRTGATVSLAALRALQPDVVVVATGAVRDRPSLPGADLPHVRTGDDLRALFAGSRGQPRGQLDRRGRLTARVVAAASAAGLLSHPERVRLLSRWWMPVGKRVAVIGGGLVGIELGEFLAERRREVTVLEPGPVFGLPMAMPRRFAAVAAARAAGVDLVRDAKVTAIRTDSVVYRQGGEERSIPADEVIVASGTRSDSALAEELRRARFEVRVVGDAADVGYLQGAIHSAWEAVFDL